MSFYSYKNANAEASPGAVGGNVLTGLNKRVCIQVKNVYDSCLCQEQLDDKKIVISNIVPVLPGDCHGNCAANCILLLRGQRVLLHLQRLRRAPSPHEQAVENAENSPCPLPSPPAAPGRLRAAAPPPPRAASPTCAWSASATGRSSPASKATGGRAHRRAVFTDQRCQEWVGQAVLQVDRDVLLCIPDDSIIPFTLESLVSAICVSGSYIGNCTFEITICVTIRSEGARRGGHHGAHLRLLRDPAGRRVRRIGLATNFLAPPFSPQSSCAFENVAAARRRGRPPSLTARPPHALARSPRAAAAAAFRPARTAAPPASAPATSARAAARRMSSLS